MRFLQVHMNTFSSDQVIITVYTAGLANFTGSVPFSCFLEDVTGSFTITVPAVEVIPGTSYSCLVGDAQVPIYNGVKASKY